MLIIGGYLDWGINLEGIWVLFVGVRKVYEFLGVVDRIGFVLRDGSYVIIEEDVNNLLDFCDW